MNSPTRLLTLALALSAPLPIVLAGGCGSAHTSPPAVDAGRDSSVVSDLGDVLDAGADVDSGTVIDSGTELDAGAETDGGPILPPYDAGDPFGDAGTLGTPDWVPLDVLVDGTTCTPLVACGGNEVGSWDVTGGCIDFPAATALSACPGATLTASGRARGRVTFTGTVAVRTSQSEVSAEVFVPAFCAAYVGGCAGLQTRLAGALPDPVCVTTGTGDCRCAARTVNVVDDGDAYTVASNQIISTTSGKHWDYCITGDQLRYRDVSTSGAVEPGIIELGRR